jgi:sec-independent protein translocase protein TatA
VGNFGATEILIVLVIGFLLFGRSRLPGMGRKAADQLSQTKDAVGEAKDEFKLGLHEVDDPSAPLKETMREAKPRPARTSWLTRWLRRSREAAGDPPADRE